MSTGTTTRARRRWLAGGLIGSATLISGLTVAARVAGFGRTVVFSHEVGAACIGNAYTTANLLPNVLYEVAAGGALAAVVVPILAGPLAQADQAEVDRIASGLLTWVVVVLAPLSLLLALAATPLAALTLPDPKCSGQRELAATMILAFAPQVLLYGVGAVLAGVLQAQRRFGWPAVAPLLSSLVVMASYVGYAGAAGRAGDAAALPGGAVAWLAGGTTLGVVVMTLPMLVPVAATGIRLRPTLRLPDGVARRAGGLAAAGIAGLLAQQAFVLTTLWLANSRLRGSGTDSLNVFQYVQTVSLLPYAVLAVPLATAAFPRLAERAGDPVAFAALAARSTRLVLVLGAAGAALVAGTAPAVAGFFVALDRGRPGGMDGALTAIAPGLIGLALIAHLGRALYAVERGRSAAVAIAAGWLTAAAVAVPLVLVGPGGSQTAVLLAAASSVGMSVAGVALVAALRRARGTAATDRLGRTTMVAVACALVAALAGRLVAGLVGGAAGTGLGGSLVAGVLAAGAVAVVLGLGLRVADPEILRGRLPSSATATETAAATAAATTAASATTSGQGPSATAGLGRVLLVLGTSAGGVGRHVAATAAGLSAAGAQVAVAAPARTLADFGYGRSGAQTFPVPIADRVHPVADLATALRLGRLAHHCDVVHAHGLRAGALVVLGCRLRAGRHTPVLVTLHNALVSGGRIAVVHRVLERLVARGADEVLVVSADLGDRMRALGAHQVERGLVPAPASAPASAPSSAAAPAAAAREAVRAELVMPDAVALLLTVARLAPQKGLELLLEASQGLSGRALVAVAGDGPLHEELAARIARDRLPVRLLGRRDDVPALLLAADLVLVPSRWEGQPLIVQEALRAGAAVVATDVGGVAELAGGAVRLVPAHPVALRDAVLDLLDHPGQVSELRRQALVRAAALPTEADALDQLVAIYSRLAGWATPSAGGRTPIR